MTHAASRNLTKDDYFTKPELEAIKARLPHDRFGTLLRLALTTGARQSELILLTKSDINPHAGTIYIHATKGSLDREIRISDQLIKDCLALPTDRLFDITTARVRQIWYENRPFKIKKHFHCFRHTFGIELYKKSRDIMFVKTAMGHKSLTSTLCYVQCVDFEEKMQENHKNLADLLG
jgi:integrase